MLYKFNAAHTGTTPAPTATPATDSESEQSNYILKTQNFNFTCNYCTQMRRWTTSQSHMGHFSDYFSTPPWNFFYRKLFYLHILLITTLFHPHIPPHHRNTEVQHRYTHRTLTFAVTSDSQRQCKSVSFVMFAPSSCSLDTPQRQCKSVSFVMFAGHPSETMQVSLLRHVRWTPSSNVVVDGKINLAFIQIQINFYIVLHLYSDNNRSQKQLGHCNLQQSAVF